MADANNNKTDTTLSEQETFRQLAEGKMSLSEVTKEIPATEEQPPAASEESEQATEQQEVVENTNPTEQEAETLESYKIKAEKEIATLNKRAKDNQAAFTNKSKELADAIREKEALEKRLAELESQKIPVEDIDLSAFEEYPQEIKDVIKGLSERNKALTSKMNEIDSYVSKERNARTLDEARRRQAEEIRQDFETNILPQIAAEIPDYDSFMRSNMGQYVEWTKGLSEGERFSFLNSKDPRDLIRGYKEFKKFLNLPYEKEAIKQEVIEKNKTNSLYSQKQATARSVSPKETEGWNAEKEWKEQQKRNKAMYENLLRR